MKGEHLEHWKHLAARVAEERDPETFHRLVNELLAELRLKEERMKDVVRRPEPTEDQATGDD